MEEHIALQPSACKCMSKDDTKDHQRFEVINPIDALSHHDFSFVLLIYSCSSSLIAPPAWWLYFICTRIIQIQQLGKTLNVSITGRFDQGRIFR